MVYNIIQPPFSLIFSEMSESELAEYFRWFLGVIPQRVDELTREVRSTTGFEDWHPDGSLASLRMLADWFVRKIETRRRSSDEENRIRASSNIAMPVPDWELTNRAFSFATDVGIYFGTALMTKYPHLHWEQSKKNRRDADYGQAMLSGFGRVSLNPVHIIVTTAYGIASGKRGPERVIELWGYWSQLAAINSR